VIRFLLLILIPAALISGYWIIGRYENRVRALFSLEYEIPVEVRQAEKSVRAVGVTARGELEPMKEVKAVAPVGGVIKELRFLPGDRVAAGTVVAIVEPKGLSERLEFQESAVKDAEALVKSSDEQLAAAEKQLAQLRALYAKDLIPRREVEDAEGAVKTARVHKDAMQAQLAQRLSISAQTSYVLRAARIAAPAAGRVTRRWLEPGAVVAEGTPVLSVAPTDPLRVIVHLHSVTAENIRTGTAVTVSVDASPEREYRGFVKQINDVANFAGDQSALEVEVANPTGALKFGTPVTLSFLSGARHDGIFVPETAVIQSEGTPLVYVKEGAVVRRRNITPGKHYNGEIEVISGLEPGDAVVVNGAERLIEGSRVRAVE
jgi:membrane fusion protein (multidrug efflux system)